MARSQTEVLVREIAKSSCMSFGTTASYQIGSIKIEKIGFADIPMVTLTVHCRPDCVRALVPIARAIVFKALEAHGLESEILEFVPTVKTPSRQSMFVDENQSSQTCGKRKRGKEIEFSFEIKKIHVGHFVWGGFCNKYGEFPQPVDTAE